MGNVKVILIKGKYQYKRQLALYQYKAIAYGFIGEVLNKLKPEYMNAVLTKKTPGDTHFIIMED